MQYAVHQPRPPLSDFVETLWSLSDAPAHAREHILPCGTIELVINLHADEFRIYEPQAASDVCQHFRGAIVSGCYSAPFGIDPRQHAAVMGVHFRPGGAADLLGVAPGEIADTHVALEDVWGSRAAELRERLCAATRPRTRFRILEEALIGRLRRVRDRRRTVNVALAELERPGVAVGAVAAGVGLSRRRFIEIFNEDVGMTPKRYARVRRFQRALARMSESPTLVWAELAVDCGYFDQAHLCREWLELTGTTPAELRALRAVEVKENHVAVPAAGVKSVQYVASLRS